MNKEQFLNAVSQEVKQLKVHASSEELSKLNFNNLYVNTIHNCIYGQMTGDCTNSRARELMDICCDVTFDIEDKIEAETLLNYQTTNEIVEGREFLPNKGQSWTSSNKGYNKIRSFLYLSSLEGYIKLTDAKNEHIISYLKDEEKELCL